jgi:hypothetical protein
MERVQGHCPMGCGELLFLGEGGHVTCSWIECPRPTAADELLSISEAEHLVTVEDDCFTIEHPLRERVEGAMHECQVHREMQALNGPPAKPGRYRAVARPSDLDSDSYRPASLPNFDLEPIS